MPPPAPSVPMIPGLLSSQRHFVGRTDFRKGQLLEQMANGRLREDVVTQPTTAKWLNLVDTVIAANKSNQVQSPTPVPVVDKTGKSSTKYRVDSTQPAWITHDRQVLRFYGYFQEPVEELGRRIQRIRRVVIFFYLSDRAISISEPRVANSGIAQGEFMKRTVLTKTDGSNYTPADFRVGAELRFYGRTFYLVGCDEATRLYYEEALNDPQDAPRRYPDDKASQLDEVDTLKQRLQAKTNALRENKAEVVRKFHENSQKVLRFFVSWLDPHPLYPETRRYVLHYYLTDDTMEVVEPKREREVRGHFAVLISRRKMASDDKQTQSDRFLTARDLRCGEYIHVYSRRFLLEDCDPFTRDYYLEHFGITQEPHDSPQAARNDKATKWKLFQAQDSTQSNGAQAALYRLKDRLARGSEEESAGRQFYKNDALEKKQLRFRARFHALPSSDPNSEREFVLTYYLEDDTLSVFEPRKKNSGVQGGRFLDRGRFRKCGHTVDGDTASREQGKAKSLFRASDFYVGAVVGFEFAPQQRLELVEADRQTLSFCENHPELFPFSDIDAILSTITLSVVKAERNPRAECRALDPRGSGELSVSDLKRLLQRLGMLKQLNAQQLITLSRRFRDEATEDEKRFVYADFCDAIALQALKAVGDDPAKRDVYVRLRKCETLRRALREADTTSAVDIDTLVSVVGAFDVRLTRSESQVLTAGFGKGTSIDYNRLCDHVFQLPTVQGESNQNQMTADRDEDDAFADFDDSMGDVSAPPLFTQRQPPASPRKLLQPSVPGLNLPSKRPVTADFRSPQAIYAPRAPIDRTTDPRVVALLQRVFGSRKYQLRKAFREHDIDKSGLLDEDAFMAAVLAIEPSLSDNDTYLIADVYFPANNHHHNARVDYMTLLDSAFGTI
ncbi:hypothetical protein Poli38472_002093 [Pythium oligandrum]|uniref:Calmodulin n=1 Tax=Pythium oligandrum TaxID=41045 RepID=A0A8K1FKT4_PYTOL|nr:hypothetical protein Poli38472_002093 [Pythium oligandrum]|eukprot:TMW63152.1 hypothetical protein Poli38472_002093 [Pythium oligandrum]